MSHHVISIAVLWVIAETCQSKMSSLFAAVNTVTCFGPIKRVLLIISSQTAREVLVQGIGGILRLTTLAECSFGVS